MKIPFLDGAYEGRSSNVSPQTCVNFFYERGADGAESLVGTPGASLFNGDYTGEVRGGISYNDKAYFVIGNTFYEFNSAGVGVSRGTLNTASGRVSLAHNGTRTTTNNQIMVVDGTTGYIFDNSTLALTEIADTDMVAAGTVEFFDGYFLFNQVDTDQFYSSAQYDGTTIDALDVYSAEGDPDVIQSLVADNRQLFVFGKKTTEVFYNSGDADTLFQRFQGGFTQTGCAAPFTAVKFDNSVMWLSENERGYAQVVRLSEGFQPAVVSTPEINYQFSTYSTVSDAFAYSYQYEGHEFYVITFPTAKATWAYDASTQKWHQRAHTISGAFPNRERYNCHVFAFGKHLFGDFENGNIYELDADLGTFNGERIPRERTSGSLGDTEQRVRISSVQLDMEEGTGDPNVATDTSIWLSWSKDGGHTWSSEIERSIGEAGDYKRRLVWRRLGEARNWTFKARTWSPNRVIIKNLLARLYGERDGS